MPQQSALEYIRTGQTPFFRLPSADPRALREVDAALIGVTFDVGTTYQPGARLAPYHLRRVSALVQSVHSGHGVDVFETVRAVDAGNVAFPPFDPGAMREAVEHEVHAIAEAGAVPFVVGGDHSIALPVLRALFRKHGPLAVLHVDAHLDTSAPETWGAPHHHGTPFRHALSEGLIAPGRLVQVGLRATWGKLTDGGFARAHEARQVTMAEIDDRGMGPVAQEVRDRLGEGPVYVSFDVDAVDPAFAPGTGTPVPGGLSAREAFQLLRALRGKRLAGMDLVEVCPPLDHADLTCHLGAHLLFEGLALMASAGSPG
jgi:agmatinase